MIADLANGKPRSLAAIQQQLFAGMTPPPRVTGAELIPAEPPFVAIFNHYESASAASWWGPFLMTGVIARRRMDAERGELSPGNGETREPPAGTREDAIGIRWLMAREWWYPPGFGRTVKQPLTRRFFGRLAQVYGFIRVPPVLDGNLTRGEGVLGVRQALALTRGDHPSLVGLAPEGTSGPGGTLREPPSGAGLFLLHLSHEKIPLLPIGWYEDEDGAMTIKFGEPFMLAVQSTGNRHGRDRAAATLAMTAIGRLLPERLRGAYSEQTR